MLSMNEIADKLFLAPERFNEYMQQGRYCEAKWLFYGCIVVAVFAEADNAVMERLFGDNGAFDKELVKLAYEKAGGGVDRAAENHAETAGDGANVWLSYFQKELLGSGETAQAGVSYSSVCGTG